jgi:hypothetical protein
MNLETSTRKYQLLVFLKTINVYYVGSIYLRLDKYILVFERAYLYILFVELTEDIRSACLSTDLFHDFTVTCCGRLYKYG